MSEKEIKILIFGLNGERYAIDIGDVERILGYIKPTEVPDVPDFVEGVINYEGKILPIINLSKKFKFSKLKGEFDKHEAKIVVNKRNQNKFGVIVDSVYEVSDVSMDRFEETPEIINLKSKEYIRGLIKLEDKIVILLNLEDLLSKDEENSIF
ncbi:MAG: chemotaxis protein CheW [Clostridiaceae bacterium]|nr:chemotaxis protein CheW [Clostridiaceae bacterium]